MNITIFINEPQGWFLPWAQALNEAIRQRGHTTSLVHEIKDIQSGDIAFYLACTVMIPQKTLDLHTHNLVCHPSRLPEGRGMSPLTWEILAGRHEIYVTLFEAVKAMDAGDIYYQDVLHFEGHELNDELKAAQGRKTLELCLRFMDDYPHVKGVPQQGEPTFYRRRKPEDSQLDANKTLAEQFDLLRVVDNERYPAYLEYRGHRYCLKISKISHNLT